MLPRLPKAPVRPPPPPTRGKTAPARSRDLAAPSTLRGPSQLPVHEAVTVKPPPIVEVTAVEPPAATPATMQVTSVPAPSAYVEDAPLEHTPISSLGALAVGHVVTPPSRRVRPRTVAGIAAGAALGLVGSLFVGYQSVRSSPSAAVAPSRAQQMTATAASKAPAVAAVPEPNQNAAAPPTVATAEATVEPPPAIPVSSSSVQSCRELLAGSYEEKLDRVGAFTQTELGKRELVRGKLEAAQHAFCNASLWDGKNIERWLNLSQLFLLRHDGAKALESAQAALALEPNNARAFTAAGDAWAMLGKVEPARHAYLAAEKAAEPDAKGLKLIIQRDMEEAHRTLNRRDFARAERVFRRVVVFDPQHAAATAGVANCLVKLGEMPLAEQWNRRAQTLAAR